MIGFQFIVEQVVVNRASYWPYTTYGYESTWNKTPSEVGYFTGYPKFQLPERAEQVIEPPVSNKYAEKYGYSKVYYTPSYFKLPDDLSTVDMWDPKYSPNVGIKTIKYCGIYTLRMNKKVSSLKKLKQGETIYTGNNISTTSYNYNDGIFKSIFDNFDPNILTWYTNSSDISLRNTNRMNQYIKDKKFSTNTLNLIPEEDFADLAGNKVGTPTYLLFTHARTGWRMIFGVDYNYKSIGLHNILKPDGTLLYDKEGYEYFLSNTSKHEPASMSCLNFVNRTVRKSEQQWNFTDKLIRDDFYYSSIMLSYDNINSNYSLNNNTNIIASSVVINDDNRYSTGANEHNYGRITKDNIIIKGLDDEINSNVNHQILAENKETGKYEVYDDGIVSDYNTLTIQSWKIHLYHLFKMFKSIKYPDIWDNHLDSGIDDPYEEGGTSTEGGGNGSFDDKNETIDSDFNLGDIISSITNSIKIWKPSKTQLNTLMSVLTSKTFLDAIINWTSGFEKYLISLNVLPVSVPATNKEAISFRTQILCSDVPYVTNTIINKDMGSILVEPYYGNAVDYKSTFDLFLPFIGNKRLQAEDVIDKVLSIKYTIDVITGACVARVYSNGTCRYEFSGNCAYTIPLNVESYNSTIQSLLLATSSIAGAMATGGASIIGTVGASSAANLAMNVGNKDMKFRGNGGTGNAAYLGTNYPYLTITRLNMSNPSEYNKFYGYPSNITSKIGNLSGYTIIDKVHLEGISATQQEINEIEQLLKEGVIC